MFTFYLFLKMTYAKWKSVRDIGGSRKITGIVINKCESYFLKVKIPIKMSTCSDILGGIATLDALLCKSNKLHDSCHLVVWLYINRCQLPTENIKLSIIIHILRLIFYNGFRY